MHRVRRHTISIKNALRGIYWAISNHPNFSIHILAIIVVAILSFLLGVSKAEVLILLLTIGFVFSIELVNTSIEALSDKVAGGKYHDLIKITKDVSAGAVLVSAITAIVIGAVIFLPKL